jgi:glycosyltransferase involved in cell wall biosynthesis
MNVFGLSDKRHPVFIIRENPLGEKVGGISRWYWTLSQELSKKGITPTILTTSRDSKTHIRLLNGVWVHELGSDIQKLESSYVDSYAFSPRLLPGPINEFVEKIQAHLLWLSDFRPPSSVIAPVFEGIHASISRRYFKILTMHTTSEETLKTSKGWFRDPEFLHHWAEPIIRNEELSIIKSDVVLSNSSASVCEAIRIGKKYVSENQLPRMELQPLGVTPSTISYKDYGSRQHNIVLVGRWEPRKGIDLAILAFNQLVKQFPNYHLFLIGEDNVNWRHKLEKMSSSTNVHFKTGLADTERDKLIANAFFSLTSSRYESFGLTIPEALRFGTPCIINKSGGMIDFLDDGGVLSIDAEDPTFLIQVVSQYEAQESWKALSRSAIDTFNSKYNSTLVAQKFEKLLK